MRLRYYLGLYGTYVRLGLKTLAQYRADFAIMVVSTAITSGATLLFLSIGPSSPSSGRVSCSRTT